MGRRKKPEEHAHSESWLVSYCDMISLLVTFFLMMMTFSTKDSADVREVGVGLLRGRGGIWNTKLYMPVHDEVDPQTVSAVARDVAALAEKQRDGSGSNVREQLDGFSMSFDLASSFAPGSAEPTSALEQNMRTLGSFLQRYTQLVVVEGFTDDRFQPTPQYPTAEAISIARAQAAAKVLLQGSTISPEQVQIAGLGSIRPRAPNDTPGGRASNRRVEVRILSLASTQMVYADRGDTPQRPGRR
ncbi:MAG: OmpA family protein [Planctomycetes bacterium]|nr:OmpA family protein [Planctomycetota bacterium]